MAASLIASRFSGFCMGELPFWFCGGAPCAGPRRRVYWNREMPNSPKKSTRRDPLCWKPASGAGPAARSPQNNTAAAMGSGALPVLATPAVAALVEEAAWKSVQPFLAQGPGYGGHAAAAEPHRCHAAGRRRHRRDRADGPSTAGGWCSALPCAMQPARWPTASTSGLLWTPANSWPKPPPAAKRSEPCRPPKNVPRPPAEPCAAGDVLRYSMAWPLMVKAKRTPSFSAALRQRIIRSRKISK